mgnify:CR=1 FL=1
MNLSPREKDKLLISMAAIVARRRLERGESLAVWAVCKARQVPSHEEMVEGLIRGKELSDEELVFSAHLFEGFAKQGANDNASAVAAMLTCAEHLLPALPADVELWVVGTGAEEVGCAGMRAFVEQHSFPSEGTYWVNFECVGGGTLHYLNSEGMLNRINYPPMLIELARRVAASGVFGEVTPALVSAYQANCAGRLD